MVVLIDDAAVIGNEAEKLGIEIYAGFAGAEVLYNDDGAGCGVATGDMGSARTGSVLSISRAGSNCAQSSPYVPKGRGTC